jgi:hypothetical protein
MAPGRSVQQKRESLRRHERPRRSGLAEAVLYIRPWAAAARARPVVVALGMHPPSISQRPRLCIDRKDHRTSQPQLPRRSPICAIKSQSAASTEYLALSSRGWARGAQFTLRPGALCNTLRPEPYARKPRIA